MNSGLVFNPNQLPNDFFWRDFAKIPENPYVSKHSLSGLKVLFVYFTRSGDLSGNDYPIAFGYMASILRMNGGTAAISIQDIDDYDAGIYKGHDLICFFPMVTILSSILEILPHVKKDFPESRICLFNSEQHQHEMVLCAPNAVELGMNIMKEYEAVDYILIGEAESSFLKLLEKIAQNNNDLSIVPSCLYKESGEVKLSRNPIIPAQLDYLPYPSRDLLERTVSDEMVNSFSPRVQSSRGCLSPCSYCAESNSNITIRGRKKPWIGRDIVKFVDEIEFLYNRYKVVFFNVIDSSFEDPGARGIERMEMFCREILRRKIDASFKIHLRVETFTKLDDSFLALLKEAGVDILVIGVESGVERELRSYRKITTVEKNVENINRLDSFGKFFPLLGHMMFSPVLRLEEMYEKVEYLKKMNRCWDFLNMSNNVLVFRGTVYHEHLKKKGLALVGDNISGVILYNYEDPKIELLAREMGELKTKCPEAVLLNNLFYDSLNMVSRYQNKMNRHLWDYNDHFDKFKTRLDGMLDEVGDKYYNYFNSLIHCAENDWSREKAADCYNGILKYFIPETFEEVKNHLLFFSDGFKKKGLSTSKLYFKTWLSLINTKVNASAGKID